MSEAIARRVFVTAQLTVDKHRGNGGMDLANATFKSLAAMASSRGKAESQVITRDFVMDGIKMWIVTPFLPGQGNCTPIKTLQPRNVPWLAPPWHRQLIWGVGAERPSTWVGTSQNLGRKPERPPLGRTWGGLTRGGSTEGLIDRYPILQPAVT